MSQPLVFSIPLPRDEVDHFSIDASEVPQKVLQIKMHQALDDSINDAAYEGSENMHDTGFVLWPSSVMLAKYLTHHASVLYDCPGNILELGAGCGLVGLTAARLLQQRQNEVNGGMIKVDDVAIDINFQSKVIMTDYNPLARDNLERNARLNDVDKFTSVTGLDFFDQVPTEDDMKLDEGIDLDSSPTWMDMEGHRQPQVSLILAADIIAYSNDGEMVANTLDVALAQGGKALILGPEEGHRFGLEGFADSCRRFGLEVVEETTISAFGNRNEQQGQCDQLARDIQQMGGYNVENPYNVTMFIVTKPCKTQLEDT
ncbi:lysine methyltransferase [Nitzschia inconspicua]|uniref:Lysine methyltransferase n=1 Tax=Nitzschia inconspicua TaxID=303405 RepID=A0A9K3LXZ4_9STRA|nr:lysine methyltransferase [Nitzschia inconspicua]KAG7370053.1 lysine methyltransferase [Nitzschia inconspicua]